MDNFITFLQNEGTNIIALVGLLLSVAGMVAKWTPTPKDDAWVAKLLGWLNLLPVSAREKLDESKK